VDATEFDPPSSIRVGETSVGRGVFATTDIPSGETIELCPIVVLDETVEGVLADYIVDFGDGSERAVLMLGYGSLYNHSEDPNAEYVIHTDDAYAFVATRDIAAGEQVTISYGPEWWDTREDRDPADPD
jgi:uncharacterized protein